MKMYSSRTGLECCRYCFCLIALPPRAFLCDCCKCKHRVDGIFMVTLFSHNLVVYDSANYFIYVYYKPLFRNYMVIQKK